MASGTDGEVFRQIRTLFGAGTFAGMSDRELLERYLDRPDGGGDAAFVALVERHGPMVVRVCRGILASPADVEDAFQATFLIFVRRAGSIRNREAVGSWLFGVALRVSRAAVVARSKQRCHETRAANEAQAGSPPRREDADLLAEIQEEIGRLPEPYRSPVLLHHIEGLSHEEASARLSCPVGTIKSRLARGREILRRRLTRRGLAPAALVGADPAWRRGVVLPDSWRSLAVRLVHAAPGRRGGAGEISVRVAQLAEGVLEAMFHGKRILVLTNLVTASLVAAGAGVLAQREPGEARPSPPPRSVSAPTEKQEAPAATPRTQKSEPAKAKTTRELARDDGKAAGKRSIAGGGHAVRFEAPAGDWVLTSVKVHGARYGLPRPPKEDFRVFLCDEEFRKLAEFPLPYSKFRRGRSEWVTLDVKPTPVPARFFVGVDFNPEATKGVYVSHDASGKGDSVVGLPDESTPFPKGDWMIRPTLERRESADTAKASD